MEINTVTISLKKYHGLKKCEEAFKNKLAIKTRVLWRGTLQEYTEYSVVNPSEPLEKALKENADLELALKESERLLRKEHENCLELHRVIASNNKPKKKWYSFR